MIEEPGRVVAVEPGAAWVETRRSSTCSGCSARNGCGQGLVDRLGVRERRALIRALSNEPVALGDAVTVGVQERALLHGALLVYLFPLLMLFAAALLASALSLSEPYVMLASGAGFLFAWLIVYKRGRHIADDPAYQATLVRALPVSAKGAAAAPSLEERMF
ncbi:SoxR reducing system RseC family protein [Pseudomonas sp.]|uniref:SoxR reducing system RseC family protein n=1 Tax=Pseudomonas sp. TaxID=306 RepID=UPI0028AC04B2|nr:SoxR reducing system RseC family protein [Pseudomonas sp.]